MKFAIYSRKSKATDKGESIGNQVEMCRNYINANAPGEEHEFLIYEDEGFSGKNTKRPEFLRMMQDAKKKRFQQVVVYRLDRISRNIVDFMTITEKLQSSSIGFVSINERFDTTTPMGRAMMQIAAVFAQLERETIAERVQDNMLMLSYTGSWLGGKTPFGFSSERIFLNKELGIEKSYSRLVPNEDMKIVRLIFERYEAAGSFHAVQVYLHERQLMAQNASQTTDFFIRDLLSNPVYCVADETARSYLSRWAPRWQGKMHFGTDGTELCPITGIRKNGWEPSNGKFQNGCWQSVSMRASSKANALCESSSELPQTKKGITAFPARPTITPCCPAFCIAPNAESGCTPNRKTKKAEVPAQTAGSTSARPRRNIPAKPARAKRCWAAELMKRC